eukprot:TRINITY_DN41817_c0_g1_i1.p1 TRINITY_DN41817_c0_g1~~TRINITY_DN41817_c0_g1_i1.p1  ORF type:complete len:273 (+),score=30.13 TRINITY_DN41817_c0_g1_i1:63-821(+)
MAMYFDTAPALSPGMYSPMWHYASWHYRWGSCGDESDGGSSCSSGTMQTADQDFYRGAASLYTSVNLHEKPTSIRVVNSVSSGSCSSLCAEAARADVVAIDMEWVPDWHAGSNNPISVMQLAFPSSGHVYVLQLERLGGKLPSAVQMMLVNPDVVKIGFALDHSDVKKLALSDISITRTSLVDVQSHCSLELGTPSVPCSLKYAAWKFLHCKLVKDKRVTCSDWASFELSKEQVHYAAMDAWVALRLFYHFC